MPEGVDPGDHDFDHPHSLDFDEMYEKLQGLCRRQVTQVPNYSFHTNKRCPDSVTTLETGDIVIFEGIFALHDERIRDLFDLKIFILCDPDLALARRLERDVAERGRDVKEVLSRYARFVKGGFDKYVKPQMRHADLIVPGAWNNDSQLTSRAHAGA